MWPWLSRVGLGRLHGDIVIERKNFTFYAPICEVRTAADFHKDATRVRR
ncbi:DUF2905 domain-containing protein [Mesorhizobium sp. M0965]